MNIEQFYRLSQSVGEEIQKQNTNYKRAITLGERFVIFWGTSYKICRRQERDSRYYWSYPFSWLVSWIVTLFAPIYLLFLQLYIYIYIYGGRRWHSGYGAVLQIGRSLVRSQLVSLEFFIAINSFLLHYGPGVDSASNRNEYQEHFLGVKATGA